MSGPYAALVNPNMQYVLGNAKDSYDSISDHLAVCN